MQESDVKVVVVVVVVALFIFLIHVSSVSLDPTWNIIPAGED